MSYQAVCQPTRYEAANFNRQGQQKPQRQWIPEGAIRATYMPELPGFIRQRRVPCANHCTPAMEYIGDWPSDNKQPTAVYQCPHCMKYREFIGLHNSEHVPFLVFWQRR